MLRPGKGKNAVPSYTNGSVGTNSYSSPPEISKKNRSGSPVPYIVKHFKRGSTWLAIFCVVLLYSALHFYRKDRDCSIAEENVQKENGKIEELVEILRIKEGEVKQLKKERAEKGLVELDQELKQKHEEVAKVLGVLQKKEEYEEKMQEELQQVNKELQQTHDKNKELVELLRKSDAVNDELLRKSDTVNEELQQTHDKNNELLELLRKSDVINQELQQRHDKIYEELQQTHGNVNNLVEILRAKDSEIEKLKTAK